MKRILRVFAICCVIGSLSLTTLMFVDIWTLGEFRAVEPNLIIRAIETVLLAVAWIFILLELKACCR